MHNTFDNFMKKVWKTLDTFENLRFWTKKVFKNNDTFKNLKTDPLFRLDEIEVACTKCDRGAPGIPRIAKRRSKSDPDRPKVR